MDAMENAYKIVVENREGTDHLRTGHECKNNIAMAVSRTGV
jgi:hypothetical protein